MHLSSAERARAYRQPMRATEHNQRTFEDPRIIDYYKNYTTLTNSEQALFQRHRWATAGKRVLDLGVGAGRTKPDLAALASTYVGIDYGQEMVRLCRECFPQFDRH